jgi:hypothetical protein
LEGFTPYKKINDRKEAVIDWAMGRLRRLAMGNIPLSELKRKVKEKVEESE